MTEPDIRVEGELRYFTDRDEWECVAYGGGTADPYTPSAEVKVTESTEDGAKASFISAWNATWGTSWADNEFRFVRNQVDGRAEDGE